MHTNLSLWIAGLLFQSSEAVTNHKGHHKELTFRFTASYRDFENGRGSNRGTELAMSEMTRLEESRAQKTYIRHDNPVRENNSIHRWFDRTKEIE